VEVARAIAGAAADFAFPLVVDPVMISKHGAPLLPEAATAVIREELMPRAALVTPNVPEAEALTGMKTGDRYTTSRRWAITSRTPTRKTGSARFC
jgi:hydroxymethylpyrimidine/phosphomethylpyrimidine kinase